MEVKQFNINDQIRHIVNESIEEEDLSVHDLVAILEDIKFDLLFNIFLLLNMALSRIAVQDDGDASIAIFDVRC